MTPKVRVTVRVRVGDSASLVTGPSPESTCGALMLTRRSTARRELPSPSEMTTANIIKRIVQNRQQYEARNAKKVKAETAYYNSHKSYVQEG